MSASRASHSFAALKDRPGRGILLLALGNDIMGDDGIGFAAARALGGELERGTGVGVDDVDIVLCSRAGFALLEQMEGYEHALILDAITTGGYPPGTVLEFSAADFQEVAAPSPHYSGLPEVLLMAQRLDIPFPVEIKVLAVEVAAPPDTFREGLSPVAQAALAPFVKRAQQVLAGWGTDKK